MELRPHQRKAVDEMHKGCVLAGGVGVGKTLTALAYYVEKVCKGSLDRSTPMAAPVDILVITTARKRNDLDWESEALHFGIFVDRENSYGGVSITVDSYQNITKYQDVEGLMLVLDEQRLVGNGKWVKAFLKMAKKNHWIMLSATPADNWIDYVPLFVANGFYRNRTEFMDEHVVWTLVGGRYPKIKGYYGQKRLRALRDRILVDMPFDRHTVRNLVEVDVEFDVETFDQVWKKRWNVYTDEPLVDSGEMHRIGRQVANSDPSRLEAIAELSAKHPRMIIFYTFNYELELLRTLHTKLDIEVAEWNGQRHENVPTGDRWIYLVQYTAGSEAWNCVTTDTIVYYSLTYSHKVFEQSQGRIDRMNTPYTHLYYYILKSRAKIDLLIWRSLSSKRDFHEGRNIKFTV